MLLVGVGETEGGTKTYCSRIGLVLEHTHMHVCVHARTPHTSFKTFKKHSVGTPLFLLKLKRDILGTPLLIPQESHPFSCDENKLIEIQILVRS